MVARALLLRPRLIVADEPVSMVDASLRATILGALRTMHLERGIAIIYITHDLATAYQISDNIVVLYRGTVVEAGAVDLVVKQPQHPYTRLLVSSIPMASPERTWSTADATGVAGLPVAERAGCKFAERCPHAMSLCRQAVPPLFHTQQYRAVACYLYNSAPRLAAAALGTAFAPSAGFSSGGNTERPVPPS
jgi:peptide/nickel transport system ATP-binding protein